MRTYREFFCRPSERSGLLGHLFLQGKSMSKVYISGKITDNENYVKDFENRARQLKSLGYYPVNPVWIYERLKAQLGREPTRREIMNEDIRELKKCDYINFLDNWEESEGAREEHETAVKENITILKITMLSNHW